MRRKRRPSIPRDTFKYQIGGYYGITNNLKRRAGEHRRSGRQGTMKQVGYRVTRESALGWERQQRRRA